MNFSGSNFFMFYHVIFDLNYQFPRVMAKVINSDIYTDLKK